MNEYQIEILTDTSPEPVTLSEVKAWLRIDADFFTDDGILNALIIGSRELLEKNLNLSFKQKTLKVRFTKNYIDLPYGPTISVTSVKDKDAVDVAHEVKGLNHKSILLNNAFEVDWFYPLGGGAPQLQGGGCHHKEIDVIYLTGFVTLPKALKNALLIQIDYMYKNIGETNMEALNPIAEKLSFPYSRNLVM